MVEELVSRFRPALIVILLWCASMPAAAQDHSTGDWESSETSLQCEPKCRSGFQCNHGECVPLCTPECGAGFMCTSGGVCVRSAPPPPRQTPPPEGELITDLDGCMPDCRSGYVCVQRQCVSACNPLCPEGQVCTADGQCIAGSEPEEQAAPARDPSLDSIVNVHFDVLGMLQFGLTPTVEFGKRIAGYARLRLPNTGLMSYVLVPRGDAEFHWGLGGAVGVHFFSSREATMRGVFGGLGFEYLFMRTREEQKHYAAYGTHALIPQLDLGYRWGFGSFLLGMGGRIGLSIPAGKYDKGLGKNGCRLADSCEEERDLLFTAGLFLDLGWFL
jgi:hypothetical protein